MIYGRRFHHSERRNSGALAPLNDRYKSLQFKYTLLFVMGLLAALIVFMGPVWYFLLQNYDIFQKLAYDTNPEFLNDLERELVWLGFFSLFSAISVTISGFYFGWKLTKKLIFPLVQMELHMRQVSRGDWKSPEFSFKESDEFFELLDTYNYFYRTLRAITQTELRILEKIVIDPEHRAAFANWKALIESKQRQLGIQTVQNVATSKTATDAPTDDPAVNSASSPYQRRVS